MPAHKSVLLRLTVQPAGKLSHCKHNKKHEMKKGELRFVVKEPGVGTGGRGYCVPCAREMIDGAQAELAELRTELG
jgi:hypothetical protein